MSQKKVGVSGGVVAGALTLSDLAFSGTTSAGFVPKTLTTAQRDALVGVLAGSTIYNSTTGRVEVYDGAAWHARVRLDGDTMTGQLRGTAFYESRLHLQWVKNQQNTTYTAIGAGVAATSGTPSTIQAAGGEFMNWAVANSTNSQGGVSSPAAYATIQNPDGTMVIYIPSGQANLRVWVGFTSSFGTTGASNDPATSTVAFRYVQGTDTNWQLYANDAVGGGTITDSGVAVAFDVPLVMRISSTATTATFYINGTSVGSVNTNMPTSTTPLAFGAMLTTTENVAKNFRTKTIDLATD